jgi:hypothetical protein
MLGAQKMGGFAARGKSALMKRCSPGCGAAWASLLTIIDSGSTLAARGMHSSQHWQGDPDWACAASAPRVALIIGQSTGVAAGAAAGVANVATVATPGCPTPIATDMPAVAQPRNGDKAISRKIKKRRIGG